MAKQKVSRAPVRGYPPVEKNSAAVLEDRNHEIGLMRQGGGRAVAARALDQFSRSGYRAPKGPTPERLTQARGAANVEKFTTTTEISSGNDFKTVPINMVRVRMSDDPFSQLSVTRALDPKNPATNAALSRAGLNFRVKWHLAGLDALRGTDPSREIVDGGGGGAPEAQLAAKGEYRAALAAIPLDARFTVEQVVLHDRTCPEVGLKTTHYKNPKSAGMIALHDLRRGLLALATAWGYLEPPENLHCAGN